MDNYLEFVQDLIDKNWGKAISGVLLMAVGWYFGKLRARRAVCGANHHRTSHSLDGDTLIATPARAVRAMRLAHGPLQGGVVRSGGADAHNALATA